jgi:hypothetical protein
MISTHSTGQRTAAIRFDAAVSLALLAVIAAPARAVEGGLGRPVSGATIAPFAGVVPPQPGSVFSVGEIYYDADIGGSRTVPVGANLTLGIDMKASFTPFTFAHIWDTGTKRWNYASAVSLSLAWVEAEADVSIGPIHGQVKDDDFGLFDIAMVPIQASYHFSETEHMALSLTVWAPTGEYDKNKLANLSLNNWTFVPTVAYTKLFPKQGFEFSGSWGVQFYTENPATDYKNGALSDFEFLAVRRSKGGGGFGVVGSWIDQLSDDEGDTADLLNGFSGHAFGIGPIFTYSTKAGERHLDMNGRWVHEFDAENRPEGDTLMFNVSTAF